MKSSDIIEYISLHFDGVIPKSTWGESSLYYNPGQRLAHGVYFCTIKEKDGNNDKSSNLDRDNIFRLSIGLPQTSYENLFGPRPKRPSKGEIINTGHDFTQLDTLMPHPIYGWMSWVQIVNPTDATFKELLPLINESYASAVSKFEKKLASKAKK